jgi:hypothetical protein
VLPRTVSLNDLLGSDEPEPTLHVRSGSVDLVLLQELEAMLTEVEIKNFDLRDSPSLEHQPGTLCQTLLDVLAS